MSANRRYGTPSDGIPARRPKNTSNTTIVIPGWRDRTEDGVRYLHAGVETGYVGSVASYFLALPWLARRLDYDLLVEDFGAPISSALAPLQSRGVLQAIDGAHEVAGHALT